jgi:error-prone DNA polymerase
MRRQVTEWDKDDIDALKFMKVDCLALRMLKCMKCASIVSGTRRARLLIVPFNLKCR